MSANSPRPYEQGPPESVLSTMNEDGSRRWIRPKLSKGSLYYKRLGVAWFLMITFLLIPHLRMNNKPLILLDLPKRQFTLFGTTFFATDTFLLLFLLLSILLSVFLFTALFGRVWCGWACPQTVYMEFLFRPIERLFEGSAAKQRKLDKYGFFTPRRLLKYVVFLLLAMVLAHAFLAYFVGTDQLWQWMQRSPVEHPATFAVMMVVTGMIFFDFTYFREQTCLVACPYGRFQSVLLDKQSAIVAYDYNRGEPRARKATRKKEEPKEAEEWGDCIECNACVVTCPTGIDIREGLQMECINCTQCIDACNEIMDKVGKPHGLIRYTSQKTLETQEKLSILRPRVFFYPLLIIGVLTLLGVSLAQRETADLTILRAGKAPYTVLGNGQISNQIRVKIANRTSKTRIYTISLEAPEGVKLIAPMNPMKVKGHEIQSGLVFVTSPRELFNEDGKLSITFLVKDDNKTFKAKRTYSLLGLLKGMSPTQP